MLDEEMRLSRPRIFEQVPSARARAFALLPLEGIRLRLPVEKTSRTAGGTICVAVSTASRTVSSARYFR